jgi:hypothetical protein
MPTTVSKYTTPACARCYLDSVRRAAREQPDPLVRDIILRAARARLGREDLAVVSEAAHAAHPRRLRPWPSEKPAAA